MGLAFILLPGGLVSLSVTIPLSGCLSPCTTTSVRAPLPANEELGQTRGNKFQGLLEHRKAASRVTRWGIVDTRNPSGGKTHLEARLRSQPPECNPALGDFQRSLLASLVAQVVKCLLAMQETWV